MKYDPDIHNRQFLRLKGDDYSQPGVYFVTICVRDRQCLFGKIIDEQMQLNDAGKMVAAEWCALPDRFSNIELDEYVIMPDHMHGIIVIVGTSLVDARSQTDAHSITSAQSNTGARSDRDIRSTGATRSTTGERTISSAKSTPEGQSQSVDQKTMGNPDKEDTGHSESTKRAGPGAAGIRPAASGSAVKRLILGAH